jgi:soluble lytic murein transglycosylase
MRISRRTAITIIAVTILIDIVILLAWMRRPTDRESRYNALISEMAGRHGVPAVLVKAVIWRESAFDPMVRGGSGEIGLMQVTPPAGEDWAEGTGRGRFRAWVLWDPRHNIDAGSWYLGRALRRWADRDDPVPFALAEYNAGPSNAQRWAEAAASAAAFLEAIDYPTTRRYIGDVMARARHYAGDRMAR